MSQAVPQIDLQPLLKKIANKNPQANLDLIQRAFDFANAAHAGQLRKSGDPYIIHPMATADLLTDLKMDDEAIAAGLLHDVPEDTERGLEDIEKEFGKDIRFMVEGITKLGKLKYRGNAQYVENLRKMFIAMAQDVRTIVIKFCDRIHNLRTLAALPPDKQKRIAMESMDIYAPIANRLGMGEIKGILEDLSFPYVYPEEYKWLIRKVKPRFEEKKRVVNDMIVVMKAELEKHGVKPLDIHGRAKHLFSLYQKLLYHNRDVSKIYDLVAIRIVVKDVVECYEVLGIVHEICHPLKGRIKDYIASPKPNGYQSIHTTVFSPTGEIVEVQIRTVDMHEEDEYGIAAHWLYKERHQLSEIDKQKYNWLQQILELQKDATSEDDYMESLKIDIFPNQIFVFTPRGDVIELPEEATPVDFAYRIHTDLGDKCVGAKVNDQIVSLSTKLRSGDMVEIFTDKNRKGPNPDWLEFVKTSSARSRIKNCIQKKYAAGTIGPAVE